ncbi:hypothetical protein ACRALDRAFT_213513 [Sodiomyces alcalophilus JCM 7366]|uniref:uncharacterized protein n=1 Tax=Sodiomyces alcalophilus JCM 7366 TaxID=591952 RepID=UPI0039B55109
MLSLAVVPGCQTLEESAAEGQGRDELNWMETETEEHIIREPEIQYTVSTNTHPPKRAKLLLNSVWPDGSRGTNQTAV